MSSLVRLRWAFVGVGTVVLLALAVLLRSALGTLDEQRRLRHEMVAERVFDEVERELSALLAHESARPSAAYDAHSTNVKRWSPFIVGYYRASPKLVIVAEDQLGPERAERVRMSVVVVIPAIAHILERAAEPPPQPEAEPELLAEATRPTSPDVLRQLNRGVKVRDRVRRSSTFHVVKAGPGTLVAVRAAGPDRWEGFVVDVPALVSMIQSWVLTAQGLDQVAALAPVPSKGARDSGAYHFRHVLASPLDEQTVWLRLSRLDDEDTSSVLYGLSGLLSTAVVLGLYALYRMVAVQVRFAERRDNFVAAVTHELKTPITAIRMYGEMLRDDMVRDEDTRRDYYRMITAEGERLSRLINNVLEHARLRQGERPMRLMAGNVELLVREVVEVMRPHIEHEGFSIELEVDPALPSARYDDDALKQVLFNVIDNALKYGRYPEGRKGGALRIRCKAVEGVVTICVRDFGPGVPAASLKTVFDPFYRAQDELTRSQPGTGIGLSLVRDLVGRMRGKVTGSNAAPGFEVEIALQS